MDGAGTPGRDASLAIVAGAPAVAHVAEAASELRYARALDAAGAGWGGAVSPAGSVSATTRLSLAVAGGVPCIAFSSGGTLRFVASTDAAGATWGTPVPVATAPEGRVDLLEVNGRPAIAFHDPVAGDLLFCRASDAAGTTWPAPISVATTGDVGGHCSMAIVGGRPAIAYHDASNDALRFVRAADADGSAWGAPVAADPGGLGRDPGAYASLAVVNGNPAVAYQDPLGPDVRYVRSTNANGSAWGASIVVQAGGTDTLGLFASLAVVNGNPAIAHHCTTTNDLRYVRATNANGTTWAAPVVIRTGDAVGRFASLVEAASNAGVAYLNETGGRLDYSFDATFATQSPTASPTSSPTASPSASPSPSSSPTQSPTSSPTGSPSPTPSPTPTLAPSSSPTASPSPTSSPSASPTASPSPAPSASPTATPSLNASRDWTMFE